MRRWLSILFLLMLPLQFSWAAVSAYCQHETGAAADHLGHHAHSHQAGADETAGGEGSGFDPDCGFCHAGSCTTVLSADLSVVPASIVAVLPGGELRTWLPAGLSAEPERPKWSRPA
ncbi:hypothetical protein [Thauera sp.]|uniref:hypothetical protein n=1 Tax=Thauera sp. TaxID=1905334 RepID=UPI0039E5A3E9